MHWIAFYNDGTSLSQYEGGTENRYEDIDRTRLTSFCVSDGSKPVAVCHIPEGGRLIYRQRVEKVVGRPEIRVWIVGCQTNRNGINSQYVLAIFPDGHVEALDRFQEGTRWLYPPVIRENESWEL